VSAKTKIQRYPDVAKVIRSAIKRKKEFVRKNTRKRLSMAEIAKKLGLSTGGLWNYQKGIRAIPEELVNVMADYFYEGDPHGAKQFRNDLESAVKTGVATNRSVSDRIANGDPLLIDVTDYPPFSVCIKELVNHFCELATLKTQTARREADFNMREALWGNEIDLAISYFANLYRAVRVHFWPTRIRIGLGAVILKRHSDKLKMICEVLAGDKPENRPKIRPILVDREVGAIHCLETLQYAEQDVEWVEKMTAESLDAKDLADKLRNAKMPPDKTGVVVVDEYTSFKVLKELNGLGIPVLPLSSRFTARHSPRRGLPASFLSIGCSRKSELRDVLEQPLNLFLETEVESSALKFFSLQKELLAEVRDIIKKYYPEYAPNGADTKAEEEAAARIFEAAYNWTLYVLGLDNQSIENIPSQGLPWSPIAKRTRARVLEEVATGKGKDTIRNQINFFAKSTDGPLSEQTFDKLCESFDLRIKLNAMQREYVLEDREILVRTIQNGLRGFPVGLPIEQDQDGGHITIFNPQKQYTEQMRVLYGFLSDLQDSYKRRVGSDPWCEDVLTKIGDFREDLDVFYLKPADSAPGDQVPKMEKQKTVFGNAKDDRVFLASFGNPKRYAGSAFVRPYPNGRPYSGDHHPGWLELFYLWIPEKYRQLKIGDQIIREAVRFAQEDTKATYLVVEVLQTLNDAITYFRKRNFQPHDKATPDGRLILKHDISR
jgi:hypothetical protein